VRGVEGGRRTGARFGKCRVRVCSITQRHSGAKPWRPHERPAQQVAATSRHPQKQSKAFLCHYSLSVALLALLVLPLSRALISRLPELRGVLSHVKGLMTQWHRTTESQQNITNRASTLGTGFRQSQCIIFHVLELRHICNYWYLQLPCVNRSHVPCRESRGCGLSFTQCYDACKCP
jgi:hypothetical protein